MNKDHIIEQIQSFVSPFGEEQSGIRPFQIEMALPSIVRQMVYAVISGNFPSDDGINPINKKGISGNSYDMSNGYSYIETFYEMSF